jgi:hypothetical protein
MTRDLRVLTGVALAVPVGLLCAAMLSAPPARGALLAVVACVALLYTGVWLAWRPTRFEIDGVSLRIMWPMRVRAIARRTIGQARTMTGRQLRDRYGLGLRIGVGGLWGNFGLLKTRATTFSMWVSRTDRLVVVDVAGARPLLVTPEEPDRFVEALRR